MGKSLGTRRRRKLQDVETSSQAVYLKVLGELGALSFDPGLRTAAELTGLLSVEDPADLHRVRPSRGSG